MHAPLISTLLLALAASVSSLSLGDLESIPSDTVTPGCLAAYNKEIAACPPAADFKAKKTCSTECVDALNTFSQETILVCRQAFVSPDSLLRRLLDGGLAMTICPASSSSSSLPSSSSVAAPTTASAPVPSKSSSTSYSAPASTPAKAETQPGSTQATPTQSPARTKTESAVSTVTPTTVAFSGFMTITASSAASTASIPAELTLDDSAEPTVSSAYGGYAAYAVVSGSGVVSAEAVQSSAAAAAGNGSPFESSSDSTVQTGAAADGVKARWGAVVLAAVALGAGLV